MRFIGSKANLLSNIDFVIQQNTTGSERIFCDIFSGTGVVGRHFKSKYEVHSNDLLYFSYAIQKASIESNTLPSFAKLIQAGISDPLRFLEEESFEIVEDSFFISKHYAPNKNCERMYFTSENAHRIDFIRNTIELWNRQGLLSAQEYYYLLASLIEGVPFVSNITGTYGAYLKHWDKRAFKHFEMMPPQIIDNSMNNKSYNMNANDLIGDLEGDILYLDPPYNSRQYAPNYHILETVARYDYPQISGVTGMRPYQNEKSSFCIKAQVAEAFDNVVEKAKFSNIILSYSSDGLLSAEQIEKTLKKHCIANTYKRYDIAYKKYQSKKTKKENALCEYLFFIKKEIKTNTYFEVKSNVSMPQKKYPVRKYIKSPLNYIGGKYKLLPQILPYFPKNIGTFVDLFCGGTNVAINVNANTIICNDINNKVIEMFKVFQKTPLDKILNKVESRINEFSLSKQNKEGFLEFRQHYNKTKDPIDLYTLTCYSFNYQFRFNNKHEYNNPFGKDRSQFSERMRSNLIGYIEKLHFLNIHFTESDFEKFSIENLSSNDMIYCDPPYLITTGTYNDGNRGFKDWGINEEKKLYDFLDMANSKNIKFALSNVFYHKKNTNSTLIEWSKKYNIYEISSDYSNSSYNTKGTSKEVLITNY